MIMKYSDSKTFKDLLHQIPKLSRPYSVFKDFPGPGKMTTFFKDFQGPVATLYKCKQCFYSLTKRKPKSLQPTALTLPPIFAVPGLVNITVQCIQLSLLVVASTKCNV